ncbi:phenylacetate--CoA ligase family protein [Methanofollis liminatans]|uniref:phenylacetate--CoA ligase family protein n=1 Tax=Methanofollis liminatans TaxID=2201 RepID=UPI001C2771C0|nr:phenylacetate--CoA ligase family protein [Methanofollis liminatans]
MEGKKNRIKKEYGAISNIFEIGEQNTFIEQRLKNLLLHAYEHTRYYHTIFNQIDLIQDGNVDSSRISDIPILTKDIIRENYNDLLSDDYQTRKWYYNSSGGSTGEPLRLVQDHVYLKWGNATNYYYYKHILDIDEPNVKKILLWGSERDIFKGSIGFKAKTINQLSNTKFLNSFRMTEQDIERYIHTINSFKPEIIRGYAGSLYTLCRYAEKKKLSLYAPKIIVSAAETLSDNMRSTIESNFGTRVYNFYGSREVSNIAGECKEGLMHLFMFWNYLELLDSQNRPVSCGEEGKVVITNLFNYSMPLIRYEIGDTAILGPDVCFCGNLLPTLKKIVGRVTDHFVLKDGTTIHGEYFTHLFYLKDWIEMFQVIQEDYKTIRILIVISSERNQKDQKDIESKIKLVMGSECKVIWDIVDDIPKTSSGKYLYTKSLVWR